MTTLNVNLNRIFLPALAALAACGGPDVPEHNARVEAGLEHVLETAVTKPDVHVPGALAHYRNSDYVPWSGSAGLGDLQAQRTLRTEDRIRAGSIVKTFISVVTLQRVEEGTLSLDQKLPELLPRSVTERIANADQITLRMLLNHTSGIPEWVNEEVHIRVATDPTHIWTNDEAIDIAAAEGAYFPPGTSWRYSNTHYTLLGMVLDRAGGKSWRAQVRERLLLPLGMFSTHLPEPGDRRIASNYARGYHYIDGTPLDLTGVDPSMSGASGGNAMVTTVADLGWFLDALLGGRLFREAATLTAMTTMIDAPHESGLPHQYGLGLESFVMPDGTKVIGHSGGAAGYAVMMFRLADQRTTLVTAINTSDLMTNAVEVFIPALNVITASVEQK